jgi:phosphopantothenoylcysteine decarboxylase/phosphopantothenate--cysteine ligase
MPPPPPGSAHGGAPTSPPVAAPASLPAPVPLPKSSTPAPPSVRSSPASSPDDDPTVARAAFRPTIALAVAGSIAAYKAAAVARLLVQRGARVIPVMTRSAREFLGPMTLSGITGEPVRDAMFDPSFAGEVHVAIAREADLVLVVPATADLLARLAQGRADDLVTALALSARGPVLAAPAMHPRMWSHPATQRNVAQLARDGRVALVGPVDGEVASGESGMGRMAEPEAIVEQAFARVGRKDLAGLRVIVTAGPTVEDLDPVRFVSNRSTGKMGFAIAERAAARGAEVTLVAGPVSLATPFGVRRVDVRSAIAMRSALWQALGAELQGADALVMTAAVGDYRPAEERASKMKRSGDALMLELVPNPDILAEIGAARVASKPVLVGFALETDTDERVVAHAQGKLESKRVDMVVANHARDAFGKDDNRATIVTRRSVEPLGVLSKGELADRILDRALAQHRP